MAKVQTARRRRNYEYDYHYGFRLAIPSETRHRVVTSGGRRRVLRRRRRQRGRLGRRNPVELAPTRPFQPVVDPVDYYGIRTALILV